MAIIGLQKGSGKRLRVGEKSVKSQGILIWIMSGNPVTVTHLLNYIYDISKSITARSFNLCQLIEDDE